MTERQLEILKGDYVFMSGVVRAKTVNKLSIAIKLGVSWPTVNKKVGSLINEGIIINGGDSYKINPIFRTHHYLLAFILMELALIALH